MTGLPPTGGPTVIGSGDLPGVHGGSVRGCSLGCHSFSSWQYRMGFISVCKDKSITFCNNSTFPQKKQFTNRNNCIKLTRKSGGRTELGYKNTNQFARVVASEMERKSLTLSQLANESGISEPYLSLILSGQRKPPGPDKIDRMTRALGLRPPMLHLLAGYIPKNDPKWNRFFDRLKRMDNNEVDGLLAYVDSLPKKRKP